MHDCAVVGMLRMHLVLIAPGHIRTHVHTYVHTHMNVDSSMLFVSSVCVHIHTYISDCCSNGCTYVDFMHFIHRTCYTVVTDACAILRHFRLLILPARVVVWLPLVPSSEESSCVSMQGSC